MAKQKTIAVVMVALSTMILGAAPRAHAESAVLDYARASALKLAHGVASIAYSPLDLVVTPIAFAIDQDPELRSAPGFGFGIGIGVLNSYSRATRGIGDTVSFLFVDPAVQRRFSVVPLSTFAMVPPPVDQRPGGIADAVPR